MSKEEKILIKEFIQNTETWFGNMKAMSKYQYGSEKMCPMCGCKPEMVNDLAKVVEKMYFELLGQ